MVYAGLLLFLLVGVTAVYLGAAAQHHASRSLHLSVDRHSAYVRYMQDKHELNRFGYAQQLTRFLGPFSSFGVSFSALSSAIGALFLLGPAAAGGPAVIGWGWPLLALFGIITACSLAMLASAFPLAGGCYHWAAAYGGRRLAVIAGWLHLTGCTALVAATNLLCAAWLNNTAGRLLDFEASKLSLGAIVIMLYLTQAAACGRGAMSLKRIWGPVTWLQLAFIFGTAGTLIAISWPGVMPLNQLFEPGGGAGGSSGSLAFLGGLILLQRLFIGGDAAAQMAEETVDPKINVPWSIYMSAVYTFIFGFVLFVVLLMQFPSVTGGFETYSALGYWLTGIWLNWGGAAGWSFAIVVALLGWSSGLASMNAGARMLFAMARDKAVPLSSRLSAVSVKYRVSVGAAAVIALAAAIVSGFLLIFGMYREETVITLVLAGMIALQSAYAIPLGLKIYTRSRRRLAPEFNGPWQLGKLSPYADIISFLWLVMSAGYAAAILERTTMAAATALFCCIAVYAEARHQAGKRKGEVPRATGANKFSRRRLEEMIRIERKFPQQ